MKSINSVHHISPLEKKLFEILREETPPCVTQVILFGSRARGDSTESSDIDIAFKVNGGCKLHMNDVHEIKNRVLVRLMGDENIKYDLQIMVIDNKDLNTPLWRSIQKEGVVL